MSDVKQRFNQTKKIAKFLLEIFISFNNSNKKRNTGINQIKHITDN